MAGGEAVETEEETLRPLSPLRFLFCPCFKARGGQRWVASCPSLPPSATAAIPRVGRLRKGQGHIPDVGRRRPLALSHRQRCRLLQPACLRASLSQEPTLELPFPTRPAAVQSSGGPLLGMLWAAFLLQAGGWGEVTLTPSGHAGHSVEVRTGELRRNLGAHQGNKGRNGRVVV